MEINGIQKPSLQKGYLGKQPKFDLYGLSTCSHCDPDICLDDNEVKIEINATEKTKVTAKLINITTGTDVKDCIFHQTSDNDKIEFNISIPEPGFYKFQIYALPASEQSNTLFGVYNYLLCCPNAGKPVRRYPKQYATWRPGCYLEKPLYIGDDNLSDVNFRVRVPGAMDVALTIDGTWVHLNQAEPAFWEGSVSLKEYIGKNVKLALNANFGGEKNKYSTLLDYML